MMKLVFATANRHKLDEVQRMMPIGISLITPADCGLTEDIPENEPTLEGNASFKARYIYEKTGMNCFADDTGLEVECLGGKPGVYSARYAANAGAGTGHDAQDNMKLLLKEMIGSTNRRARFRTVILLIVDGIEHQFEGVVEGEIRTEQSGVEGFGYDPLFEPDGYDITFAEMPIETKNLISHRGRATAKLVGYLQNI